MTVDYSRLKVAVLGTRHVHAEGLVQIAAATGATIVGAHERDPRARSAWAGLGLGNIGTREAVLAEADAVIVAGTNAERVDDTLAALEAGCAVLSEKPVAMNEADLERLLAHINAASSGKLSVALPVRFGGALVRARDAIRAGSIGTPIAGRGTNHGQFPGGWFGSLADAGGGAIMDHTVHVSDALCWLLDDRIEAVYAESTHKMYPNIEVESGGILTMNFASGFFASLDASWSRPASFHTWGDVWVEIMGTEGRIVINPMARHMNHFSEQAGKLLTVGYDEGDMTGDMVRAFLASAAGAEPTDVAPASLAEGVHASETVFAAYRSCASGKVEQVRDRLAVDV
ncbi:MAG: Gfo/Idh/MocA family oxidoreductase [Thermoleophilia bacterium]|nr:Gfo/Idh/MocA family oxidoreductase [Thermoleophilia bacterium]